MDIKTTEPTETNPVSTVQGNGDDRVVDSKTTEPTATPPIGPIGRLTLDAIDYYHWVMQETSPYPPFPTMGNTDLAAALTGACFSAQFPDALAASRRLGLTPPPDTDAPAASDSAAPSVHALPPGMYVARTASPLHITDAAALARLVTEFQNNLTCGTSPDVGNPLIIAYAEALFRALTPAANDRAA